ncbi:MAG: sugar phosphate isomerase/epimerase family protein [Phycisphaerales bacterium JB063]
MPTLGHGSDLTLAPTLGPIVRAGGQSIRAAISALAGLGFPSIQLDAALPGVRPRELDQRARRDLVATAQRAGLSIAGVDLFIPRQHLLEAEHLDRATQALLAAIEFAADLGRVPLSAALPVSGLPSEVSGVLLDRADALGVVLAVHAEDQPDPLATWIAQAGEGIAGIAIDPASVLASQGDPVQRLQQAGKSLAVARLSDTQHGLADGSRLPVGSGDLDVSGYRLSADLAPNRTGPIVLDLRGLSHPASAAVKSKQAWDSAALKF